MKVAQEKPETSPPVVDSLPSESATVFLNAQNFANRTLCSSLLQEIIRDEHL